jgi:hypothetical protein
MACRAFRKLKLASRGHGSNNPVHWPSGSGGSNSRPRGADTFSLGIVRAPVEVSINREIDIAVDSDTKNDVLDESTRGIAV